jgi:hypothetical protein
MFPRDGFAKFLVGRRSGETSAECPHGRGHRSEIALQKNIPLGHVDACGTCGEKVYQHRIRRSRGSTRKPGNLQKFERTVAGRKAGGTELSADEQHDRGADRGEHHIELQEGTRRPVQGTGYHGLFSAPLSLRSSSTGRGKDMLRAVS